MSKLGRKPEIREKIQAALDRFEADILINRSDTLLLGNFNILTHATGKQACQFQRAAETLPGCHNVTCRMTRAWLRVLRIRYEQDSVEAKRANRS